MLFRRSIVGFSTFSRRWVFVFSRGSTTGVFGVPPVLSLPPAVLALVFLIQHLSLSVHKMAGAQAIELTVICLHFCLAGEATYLR